MTALAATNPTADVTATLIADGGSTGGTFLVKNTTGSASVYVGATGVTTTGTGRGFPWAAGDGPLTLVLKPGQQAYGIVTATPQVLEVLEVPSS